MKKIASTKINVDEEPLSNITVLEYYVCTVLAYELPETKENKHGYYFTLFISPENSDPILVPSQKMYDDWHDALFDGYTIMELFGLPEQTMYEFLLNEIDGYTDTGEPKLKSRPIYFDGSDFFNEKPKKLNKKEKKHNEN